MACGRSHLAILHILGKPDRTSLDLRTADVNEAKAKCLGFFPPDLREAGPRPRETLNPSTAGHTGAGRVRDRLAPAEWQGPRAASAGSAFRVSAQQCPGHGGWSREMVWE